MIEAVGWSGAGDGEPPPRVLDAALFGIVAIADESVVGCAFVTTDNAGFYYVRDVIVHTDWQNRHIGTALIQAVMDHLRLHAPAGSIVGLFTGDRLHDFHSRFGFRGPKSGIYGMTTDL